MEDSQSTTCPRCGFKMKYSDRACVNCGMLNPYHPSNQALIEDLTSVQATRDFARKHDINYMNEPTIPFYATFILFLCLGGIPSLFVAIANKILGFSMLATTAISIYELACFSNLLQKSGNPWWASLVPIANIYFMYKLAFDNAELILSGYIAGAVLTVVMGLVNPGLSVILAFGLTILILGVTILYNIKLAKRFGANEFLTLIIPFIMIPYMAFYKNYRVK